MPRVESGVFHIGWAFETRYPGLASCGKKKIGSLLAQSVANMYILK
jgi:hypothetical protein